MWATDLLAGLSLGLDRHEMNRQVRNRQREEEKQRETHLNGEDSRPLLGNTLGTTGTGSLVGSTTSLHLVGENLGTVLLGLGLVDVVHKNTLKSDEGESATKRINNRKTGNSPCSVYEVTHHNERGIESALFISSNLPLLSFPSPHRKRVETCLEDITLCDRKAELVSRSLEEEREGIVP